MEPDRASLLADRSRATFVPFGTRDYGEILALQERLRDLRAAGAAPDAWLFGEHPTVLTQGVRAGEGDVAAAGPLAEAPRFRVDRGGMTTLHSPGQLILYPIVALAEGSLGAGAFARALLAFMRGWIRDRWGVEAETPPGRPGLFVGGRKLLSVGVSARRGTTMHGVALNVRNDLSLWSGIVACGEPGTRPTSIAELLGEERAGSPADAAHSIREAIRADWGYETMETDEDLDCD